jgi:hypothetical protein
VPFQVPRIDRKEPVNVAECTTIPTATQKRGDPHETSVHSLWPPVGGVIG